MINKKIVGICTLIFIILLSIVIAVPPIPTEFYGTVNIYDENNTPYVAGSVISAGVGNVTCGSFTMIYPGYYGVLTCLGDDNYTTIDEGNVQGQNVIFTINNLSTTAVGDTVWYQGKYHNVNLTLAPSCPNGFCELTESCVTCAEDCGLCPPDYYNNQTGGGGEGGNASGGGSGGAGGGGGGSSSSGGGGGGSSSSSGGGGGGAGGQGYAGVENLTLEICQEDWICSDWTPLICPIESIQTRSCTDANECLTFHQRPDLNQSCIYLGTCDDVITNQDETDIDCGGLICEPCEIGKTCKFDFDCYSGFCHPENNTCAYPTCNDEYKNQNEEGIDCGGPCPPCERPTLENPQTIYQFLKKGCGPFPWWFVLISSVVTLIIFGGGQYYIKRYKEGDKYKKLKKLDQLIKMYDLNRNLEVFLIIVMILEIAIALYLYYLCEINLWIIIMIFLIIPLIISVIIKYYVYDEKRKKIKLHKLIMKHEDHIRRLIEIEREEIKKEEKKVFNELDKFDYKSTTQDIAVILKDVKYLIKEYLESKDDNSFEIENSLAETISLLDSHNEDIEAWTLDSESNKEEEADQEEKPLEENLLLKIFNELKLIEKIHRDILVQYKKLQEDEELDKELEIKLHDKQDKDEDKQDNTIDKNEENLEEKDKDSVDEKSDITEEKNIEQKQTNVIEQEQKLDQKLNYKSIKDGINKSVDKEKYLSDYITKYPNDTNLLFMLASFYHRNNLLDKAEETYKKILELNESHKASLYYLASLFNQQKRLKESLELYEKIIAIDINYLKTNEYYQKVKTIVESK
jgi:hypothetical protein